MSRRAMQEAEAQWAKAQLAVGAGRAPGAVDDPLLRRTTEAAVGDLRRTWIDLELPPVAIPPDFARRISRAWNLERSRGSGAMLSLGWMRAAAAAALFAGVALGTALAVNDESSRIAASDDDAWQSSSLSEEYLSALALPEAPVSSVEQP
ncbi:MAG: hypothetical protein ABI639_02585 [Thermoanaerobaculia bacterium]